MSDTSAPVVQPPALLEFLFVVATALSMTLEGCSNSCGLENLRAATIAANIEGHGEGRRYNKKNLECSNAKNSELRQVVYQNQQFSNVATCKLQILLPKAS